MSRKQQDTPKACAGGSSVSSAAVHPTAVQEAPARPPRRDTQGDLNVVVTRCGWNVGAQEKHLLHLLPAARGYSEMH